MAASKITITIKKSALIRLESECGKLDPREEKDFAEEGFGIERDSWPEY